MKKILKQSVLLSITVMVLCMVFVSKADAATNPLKKMPTTYKQVFLLDTNYYFATPKYSEKITIKATSSNKKVAIVKAKVRKIGKKYIAEYTVTPKGYGKTNIKVTVEAKGKKYKKTCIYFSEKYVNPFKSIKIGKDNYTTKFNKTYENCGLIAPKNGTVENKKISIKMKSGYKLLHIYGYDYHYFETGEIAKVKNDSKLKDFQLLEITYKNKKTGAVGTVGFDPTMVNFEELMKGEK